MLDPSSIQVYDFWLHAAAYVCAGIAFLIGLWQYRQAQTYQRASVLLNLIEAFEKDEKIAAACRMIDWDEREVQLGEGCAIKFTNDVLISALQTPRMDVGFTAEQSKIRDAFDSFLDFFHKVYGFWESKVFRFEDLQYFYYWFELLYGIGDYKQTPTLQTTISDYIKNYRFVGIENLLKRYAEERAKDPDRYRLYIKEDTTGVTSNR